MAELEQLLAECARALRNLWRPTDSAPPEFAAPFERLSCQQAFLRYAGFDPLPLDADALGLAGRGCGVRVPQGAGWDDAFTQVLLEKIEPQLGLARPTYLYDYPVSQAALARRSLRDPRVAERFELYARGLELCNGFSELTDAAEQRARFEEERALRGALGRAQFPLDEQLLAALPAMPETGGVAVGVDRLLMLLTGARGIAEVLLFPACEEYPHAPLAEQGPRGARAR